MRHITFIRCALQVNRHCLVACCTVHQSIYPSVLFVDNGKVYSNIGVSSRNGSTVILHLSHTLIHVFLMHKWFCPLSLVLVQHVPRVPVC